MANCERRERKRGSNVLCLWEGGAGFASRVGYFPGAFYIFFKGSSVRASGRASKRARERE